MRDGDKAALLVVDVQVGVMANSWDAERIVTNVARVVERARTSGVPVIWVQHADQELVHGSDDWQFVRQLLPSPSEVRIEKSYNSAFEDTDLEEELARIGASRVLLAGAATNWCIRATAYGALDRGYDLILIEDAHTTETMVDGERTIQAADIVEELNSCMMWVSYPGRTSDIATAEAAVF